MISLFADTSFYIAVVSPADARHREAVELASNLRTRIITTQDVLTEAANFLCRAADRTTFVELYRAIDADTHTEVVSASKNLWLRGLELFRRRSDKNWSLTDCISFVVMQERGLREALTADHHFEQAGFTILLS